MKRWAWVAGLGTVCGVASAQQQVVSGAMPDPANPNSDSCNVPRTDDMQMGGVTMSVDESNCPAGVMPGDIDLTFHFGFVPTQAQIDHALNDQGKRFESRSRNHE